MLEASTLRAQNAECSRQVLSLLALLVQKYQLYWYKSTAFSSAECGAARDRYSVYSHISANTDTEDAGAVAQVREVASGLIH